MVTQGDEDVCPCCFAPFFTKHADDCLDWMAVRDHGEIGMPPKLYIIRALVECGRIEQ